MSQTTYEENKAAAITSVFQDRLAGALSSAAVSIMSEDYTLLSPPSGFYPDDTSDERKKKLHYLRAALASKVVKGAFEYATAFSYSAAEYMNVKIEDTTDSYIIVMNSDDEEAVDSDFDNCASALWDAWACNSHG